MTEKADESLQAMVLAAFEGKQCHVIVYGIMDSTKGESRVTAAVLPRYDVGEFFT